MAREGEGEESRYTSPVIWLSTGEMERSVGSPDADAMEGSLCTQREVIRGRGNCTELPCSNI